MTEFQAPKGVPDYLPPESAQFVGVRDGLLDAARRAGYGDIELPIFEDTALSVDVIYRRRQNMFEDNEENVLWNDRGSDNTGFRNGEPRFIFDVGTPDDAMGQYIGLDATF